ncbi:MATE family efflux transporter [Niameybacter massiliensis]|uniref:MATE family efflux transporter n=1 Tax=Niameybacter massiliensis TaxID=1658108 RepID=UPI0006B60EDB|nr:MATE family efflux transporter [Niameybacter massiliensis]
MIHTFLSHSKVILLLAFPVIIENILQVLLGTTDTYFAGKLAPEAIAAIGSVNLVMNIFIAFITTISVGASAIIARYIGLKELKKAKVSMQQAIILACSIGLVLGLLSFIVAKPLLLLLGTETNVLKYAIPYFYTVGIPCVFLSLMMILSSTLRSMGDTKTPMIAAVVANLLNMILNYVLIFGLFNIPGLGIVGAGLATTLSRIVAVSILIFKLYHGNRIIKFQLRDCWILDKKVFLSILGIGMPAGIEKLIMRAGQMVYGSVILSLGTSAYVAHNIAGTIESYSYLPAMGFGIAAATLVGQSLGAKNVQLAKQYGLVANILSTIVMILIGLFFFTTAPILASLFTNDMEIQSLVVNVLRIIALFQPFLSITNVIASALQGAGDTKFPMYATLIGVWGIRVVFGYFFAVIFNLGLVGIWLAYSLDILLRGLLLMYRFLRGKWYTTIVLE